MRWCARSRTCIATRCACASSATATPLGSELARSMQDAESLTAAQSRARALGRRRLRRPLGHRAGLPLARGRRRRGHAARRRTSAETQVAARLALAGMPDPDLLIRTGGERRISNFLLWNLAYTELYFTDVLWPEFSPAHLEAAFEFFAQRERRFGKTSAQVAAQSRCLGCGSSRRSILVRRAAAGTVRARAALDRACVRRRVHHRRVGVGRVRRAAHGCRRGSATPARSRCCCC